MECPCRYCQERTFDCHGKCERYLSWNKQNDATRKKVSETINIGRLADEDVIRRRMKNKK